MKVRFRHEEHQPAFWRPMKHALRVTLGLTDTEHYLITRLGSWNTPLYCYQIDYTERAVSLADCVAGVRLDFDNLSQANEAQNLILRALEKFELILRQDTYTNRVDTFTIPQEERILTERLSRLTSKNGLEPRLK
jgi:hypothetical protein